MSILKRVIRNFSWTVVSEIALKGAIFTSNIYLARTLGVENFGLFTLVQTGVFYVWLSVDLGSSMYGIKEVSRQRRDPVKIIGELFAMRIMASIIIYISYVIVVLLLPYLELKTRLVSLAAGFYLITYAFYSDWVLKGLEEFRYVAIGNIITSTVLLVGLFILVNSPESIVYAAAIWSLSYIFGAFFLWVFLRRILGDKIKLYFLPDRWWYHLRSSFAFSLTGSIGMVYQYLPLALLGMLYGKYYVGIFSAPYKLVFSITTVGFFISMAFYPVLAQKHATNLFEYLKICRNLQYIMLSIGIAAGASIFLIDNIFLEIIYGSQYHDSATVFSILIVLIPLYFIRYSYGIPLSASGNQAYVSLSVLFSLIAMLVFGWPLIKSFSAIGAAISLLISESFTVIGVIYFYLRNKSQYGLET